MRTLSRYGDDFDRDAAMQSEARVVNVHPTSVARFEIATRAGSPPRRYKLKPGEGVHVQVGYTQSFQGAGRQPVRPTIESLTEREIFQGSKRTLPMVVHETKAAETRRAWEDAIRKGAEPPKPVDVMLPSADGGEPIKMTVTPTAPEINPLARREPEILDDEDQGGGKLDDPPPEHDEPLDAVQLPTKAEAPTGKKGRG